MSNTKTVMGQAANTQGIPLDITDVFSTYLYTGNSASQPINNGVDLNGEGGMVWLKARTAAYNNIIVDSERGSSNGTAYNLLFTNLTNAENTAAGYGVTSFNSNGFTLGPSGQQVISNQGGASYGDINYASWTFRKAPKFFDVVTYTGDGTTDGSKKVLHNLGSAPGCIIVKRTDSTGEWNVYHRGITSSPETRALYLNQTSAYGTGGAWGSTLPTDTEFTVGSSATVNISNATYVAYLFAHNDGDGEFGPNADQDIIKCGSYVGNGSTTGPEIDLGFEPQWVLVKSSTQAADWTMYDNMRGAVTGTTGSKYLHPNKIDAEATRGFSFLSNGFQPRNSGTDSNTSGQTYIYMAIRRGSLAQPESGTEVFAISTRNASEPAYTSGFPVDFAFARAKNIANNWDTGSRLQQGNRMFTNLTNAEATNSNMMFDYQEGWSAGTGASTDYLSWMWKRAPGFCDVVAYTGDGTYPRNIAHNLSATPEMVIIKARNWSSGNWAVHHKDLGYSTVSYLDNVLGSANQPHFLTASDASTFTVGSATSSSNYSNSASYTYIAYLFATLPGVSKVGSYTGNGTSQTIDCGFTSGARFVLSKCVSHTGAWYVFDTERGIVSGNDRVLELDSSNPEVIYPGIDPQSSGFIVNDNITNESGRTFIFYAIA